MSALSSQPCPVCGATIEADLPACPECGEVRDGGLSEEELDDRQQEVCSLLRRGVVFSIVWLMGFGSLYAAYCGFRAYRIIRSTEHKIYGIKRVVWCFVVGGIGLCFWLPVVGALLFDIFR
jgi:predicted nucleic acid-binding Zn ribbon protein